MNLLVERSADPKLPSVNTLNTFFYPKLCSSGYSAVRRWTKKMDIFSKDILLVPVHLGVHWCLSVSIICFSLLEFVLLLLFVKHFLSLCSFRWWISGRSQSSTLIQWVETTMKRVGSCCKSWNMFVCIGLSLSDVSPEEIVTIPTVITCNRRAKTRRAKKWIPQAGLCTAKSAM